MHAKQKKEATNRSVRCEKVTGSRCQRKNMKCSKKLLAATVTAVMLTTMGAGSVFAVTGTTENTSASTDVKYNVTQGYEWVIHSEINFNKDAGAESKTVKKTGNTVSVTRNVIPEGKKLQITIKGNNGGNGTEVSDNGTFAILNGTNTRLNYAVTADTDTFSSGDTILDVKAGTMSDSKNLTFTLTTTSSNAEVAGEYTGKVIYTASIVDQ